MQKCQHEGVGVGTKGRKSNKKKILNVKKLIDSKIKKGYKIKKE